MSTPPRQQARIAIPCPICNKPFTRIGHLNRHQSTHTDARPFVCTHPQCEKTYTRADHLAHHLQTHDTSPRPFVCPVSPCEKSFLTKAHLNRHTLIHTRAPRFICAHCPARFSHKARLNAHAATHGQFPFACDREGCEEKFSYRSRLERHIQRKHSLRSYFCSQCEVPSFQTFSALQKHTRHQHPLPPRQHECTQCGRRFGSGGALQKHIITHSVLAPDRQVFACAFPGCQKRYTSSGNLGTHVRANHINRDAFRCLVCSKRFSLKSSLQRHERNLHSKTPGMPASSDAHGFRCAHCPLVFVRRGGLKRHRRVAHGVLMPVSLEERGGDESDASLIAARVQASHSDSEPSYNSNASSFNASQQSDDHDEVSSTMPHKRRKLVSDASHPSKLPVVVSKALPLDHSSDVESSGSQRDVELKEGSHDRNPSHDKPRKCADILVKDNSTNDIPVSAQEK